MDSLQQKTDRLQHAAQRLLTLGEEDNFVDLSELYRLEKEIHLLAKQLHTYRGENAEQEAALCIALLMAYNAMMGGTDIEKMKQQILNRAERVLNKPLPSLLKCSLLAYCYGEVYDEYLSRQAHSIIDGWRNRGLMEEEKKVVEILNNFEKSPYPHCEAVG